MVHFIYNFVDLHEERKEKNCIEAPRREVDGHHPIRFGASSSISAPSVESSSDARQKMIDHKTVAPTSDSIEKFAKIAFIT